MARNGPPSLWLEEIADQRPVWPHARPQSDTKHRCDCLVIGAGLSGSSSAAAIARAGQDVLLVDAFGPGSGASGRNAGFVLLGNAVEYPNWVEHFGREFCRDLLGLARRNHQLIRERWGADCDYEASGSLMLSMGDDDKEIETLRVAARMLREDGVDCELRSPSPGLKGYAEELCIHEDAQLHPAKLCLAMQVGLPRTLQAEVSQIDLDEGVAVLGDGAGEIHFDRLVVATNAHAAELLPELAQRVTPQRAQVYATEPLAQRTLLPCAYAAWGYDYFRQRSDGRFLIGGRRHLFRDSESTDEAVATQAVQASLREYVKRHLPDFADAAITHRWAGIMGFSLDELPYVDRLACARPAWVLAGFTGHGLGLAPACGELVAAKLLGGVAGPHTGLEDDPLGARMLAGLSLARIDATT